MSRHYEMTVEVRRFNHARMHEIEDAANAEWSFDDWDEPKGSEFAAYLLATGRSNLCGGESEEEFAARLSLAIWRANKAPCTVDVTATYLEELPFEAFGFTPDRPPPGWNPDSSEYPAEPEECAECGYKGKMTLASGCKGSRDDVLMWLCHECGHAHE